MTLQTILKSYLPRLLSILLAAGGCCAFILFLPKFAVWIAPVWVLVCGLAGVIWGLPRRREFYENNVERVLHAPQPHELAASMTAPGFPEGDLLCRTLSVCLETQRRELAVAQKADCDLRDMIAAVLREYLQRLMERKVSVTAKQLEQIIYTDPVILRQMLRLVLENAARNGGEQAGLRFTCGDSGGTHCLSVEHTDIVIDSTGDMFAMLERCCKAVGATSRIKNDEEAGLITLEYIFPKKSVRTRGKNGLDMTNRTYNPAAIRPLDR